MVTLTSDNITSHVEYIKPVDFTGTEREKERERERESVCVCVSVGGGVVHVCVCVWIYVFMNVMCVHTHTHTHIYSCIKFTDVSETAQHNLAGCRLDNPCLNKYQYMRQIVTTQSLEPAIQEWVF
jgi:hypothetical protein